MTDFKITDKSGIKLKTANKYVMEDLAVTLTNEDINNTIPENIKKGISILGITGTFEGGITPSGKINITNTEEINVTNYATAQVVDSNLSAENIKKDISILGVTGTFEGESGGDTTQEDGLITREGTSYTNNRVTKVGQYVFYKSNLTTVNISNATSIENYAFQHCKNLISINLPKATSISNQAFASCTKLAGVDFPNATSIGNQAFEYCSNLTNVSLPKVTNIGSGAFFFCSSLISVNISKVTSIGEDAFMYCYPLMKVIITQTDSICTLLSSTVFKECYHFLGTVNSKYNPEGLKDGRIYVPDALVSSYKTATNWSAYADIIVPLSTLVE